MLNLKIVLLTEWRNIVLFATNRMKDDAHISAPTAAQKWTEVLLMETCNDCIHAEYLIMKGVRLKEGADNGS